MTSYAHPLLTDDDLSELTGYDAGQVRKQIAWLQRNGVQYVKRRDGKPRTTWGAVESALLGNPASGPNLEGL